MVNCYCLRTSYKLQVILFSLFALQPSRPGFPAGNKNYLSVTAESDSAPPLSGNRSPAGFPSSLFKVMTHEVCQIISCICCCSKINKTFKWRVDRVVETSTSQLWDLGLFPCRVILIDFLNDVHSLCLTFSLEGDCGEEAGKFTCWVFEQGS